MGFWIKTTEYGLYLTLFISLLMFGAGFIEGYTLLAFMTLLLSASLLSLGMFRKSFFLERWTRAFLLILIAWLFFLCIQLLPFPTILVQFLSPKLVELYQKFGPSSLTTGLIPLSIAWEDGFATVLKHMTYVALFFISYCLIRDKAVLKRFNFALVLMALSISLLGLVCLRISPGKIYGIFSFEHSTPLTPYLNKNHFANFLVMTLPATLGLLILLGDRSSLSTRRSFKEKILWFSSKEATLFLIVAGIFVIEFIGLIRASSRGGLLGLAGGLSTFMGLLLFIRRKRWFTFVLFTFIVIGSIFAIQQVHPLLYKLKLLSSMNQDYALSFRLSNWLDTVQIFRDFPLAGIGASSFDQLFPLYKTIPEKGIFTQTRFFYAENEFLQGLAETGIIGSSLLVSLFIVLTVSFLKKWRKTQSKTATWLFLGMVSGCFGMLAHSLVDFPMHIPANMALFAVLGGAIFRFAENDPLALSDEKGVGNLFFLSSYWLKRLGTVMLGLLIIVPLLWRHYLSEHLILKANEHLNYMSEEKRISPASVLAAYEYLLKERQLGMREKSHVDFALGKVYAYLGLLRKGGARFAWFQQAEDALLRAIKLYPFNAAYHYTLGWLYQEWEKPEQARLNLKNAMELEPQNPFYRFKFGENEARLGNIEAAHKTFKETVEININYIEDVLAVLMALPTETKLEEFELLLPENENRLVIQNRMVRFFQARQEHAKAEALQH